MSTASRRLFKLFVAGRLGWMSVIVLAGIAFWSATAQSPEPPFPPIPDAFLRAFPQGEQPRSFTEIKAVFDHDRGAYSAIFDRYRRYLRGNQTIVLAIAIDPEGHVAGESLLHSTESQRGMESAVLQRVQETDFGPVTGAGYFVIRYPFIFRP